MEQDRYFDPATFRDEDLAKVGQVYFMRASMKCPASATAQGATIALWCRQSGVYQPEELGMALLDDKQKMATLISVANSVHQSKSKGPEEVSYDRLYGIVYSDFCYAQRMMILDGEDLQEVSDILYVMYQNPRDLSYEGRLDRYVSNRVRAKEKEAAAPMTWRPLDMLGNFLSRFIKIPIGL